MSRAVCTAFHRYHPHVGDHYKVQFDMYLKSLEYFKDDIDHLYLIDSYWNFTEDDLKRVPVPVTVIPREKDGHHWVQFKTALPYLKEDRVLFLDNDVVVTDRWVVNRWFMKSEEFGFDLVTAFDGSGGLQDLVREKFPILKEYEANRMGSYYFVANRAVLEMMDKYDMAPIHYPVGTGIPELNYRTKNQDWSDSFGYLTIKILGDPDLDTTGIPDPRESIYLEEDNSIKKVPDSPNNLGYYHIRNGYNPMFMISSRLDNIESYNHYLSITPRRELLRILAWYNYGQETASDNKYEQQVKEILADVDVSDELWGTYMDQFKEYHKLP